MTVKSLIEILKKSADDEDIVYKQFYNEKEEIECDEITEVVIKKYNEEDGCVELW